MGQLALLYFVILALVLFTGRAAAVSSHGRALRVKGARLSYSRSEKELREEELEEKEAVPNEKASYGDAQDQDLPMFVVRRSLPRPCAPTPRPALQSQKVTLLEKEKEEPEVTSRMKRKNLRIIIPGSEVRLLFTSFAHLKLILDQPFLQSSLRVKPAVPPSFNFYNTNTKLKPSPATATSSSAWGATMAPKVSIVTGVKVKPNLWPGIEDGLGMCAPRRISRVGLLRTTAMSPKILV